MATQRAGVAACGFEGGQSTVVANTEVVAATGTWAIEAASARSGDYGLRLTMSASRSYIAQEWPQGTTGVHDVFGRFYVMFTDFPSSNYGIFGVREAAGSRVSVGFEFNASSNKVRPWIRDESADTDYAGSDCAATLSEDVWYRLDFRLTKPTTTSRRVEWYLSVEDEDVGSAESQMDQSSLPSTTYYSNQFFGESSDRAGTTTGEMLFDDFCMVDAGVTGDTPSFPLGPGRVVALRTTSDLTHVGGGDFTDDGANTPPSSVYDRVDEAISTSTADYVYQSTAGGSSYLKCDIGGFPTDWATGIPPNAATVYFARRAPTAGTHTGSWLVVDTDTGHSVQSFGITSTSTTALTWEHDRCDPYTANPDEFTRARWEDDFEVWHGASTDIAPVVRWEQWICMVDYPHLAPTGVEGWGIVLA